MKFDKLELSNFGPVASGTINNDRITVFFGPNNSGKSMISRLIHSIALFDPEPYNSIQPPFQHLRDTKLKKLALWHILHSISLFPSEMITQGKRRCTISIENDKGNTQIRITPNSHIDSTYYLYAHRAQNQPSSKQSIYMPASRTGTIQFFTNITQMRSRLLDSMFMTLAALKADRSNFSAKELKQFLESMGTQPAIMNEFYDMILDIYTNGITSEFQVLFKTLFAGQVNLHSQGITKALVFQDSQGVSVNIEDAGSGVVSSFPLLLGLLYVTKGGTLIIEEPEAHMETEKLFNLIDQLWAVSKERKIRLLFTTHSDSVIPKLLSMVNQGMLKPSELGLYYFNREQTDFTVIEKMNINNQGEVNQRFFEKPMDILINEFSK